MSEIKKESPSPTVPRGSNWLQEASKRAAATNLKTAACVAIPAEVPKEPKGVGRTAQRRRLRDKIDEVVAEAARNSAGIATAPRKRDR